MYSLQLSWLGVSQMPTPGNTIKLNVGLCWNLVELRNLNLKVVNSRNNLRRGAQIVESCCCRLPSLNLFLLHHSSPCSPPDPSLTPFFTPGCRQYQEAQGLRNKFEAWLLLDPINLLANLRSFGHQPTIYASALRLVKGFYISTITIVVRKGDFYQQLD